MTKQGAITIGKRKVGPGHPAYIIAEIGSNFDGSLKRAKDLALMCKKAGADAYKIQNFLAPKLVSAEGFKNLQVAHQAKWKKSAYDVYKDAEFPRDWVKEVADYCKKIGIDFFSSPYDFEAVDMLEDIGVAAHKIGSGEIDNLEFLTYVAKTKKPVILSVGAATMADIELAVRTIRNAGNTKLILLQCVTSYPTPIADSNLAAMVMLRDKFNVVVGYSDHTIGKDGGADDPLNGITIPVGTVALGGSCHREACDRRSLASRPGPFVCPYNGGVGAHGA
jgi:sialic acid synthase SpsE